MAYRNYLDHEHYGEVWYEITLRNWFVLDNSAEENRAAGPIFEMCLLDGHLVAAGGSIEDTEQRMMNTLDAAAARDVVLVPCDRRVSWYQKWRIRRFNRKCMQEGRLCPVTGQG